MLLDEDLDVRLRHHFGEAAEVETVQYRGWKRLKNGALLQAASAEFDVLVTMDDNLPHLQSMSDHSLSVIILRAKSKALDDLLPLMQEVRRILPQLRRGEVIRVHPPVE